MTFFDICIHFVDFILICVPCEVRVLLVLLDEVGQRGEDEDTHGQEEKKQTQLFVAVLQRVGDGL